MIDQGDALPLDDSDITTDRLFDGRLLLRQFRKGHRAGTDAVLLATEIAGPIAGTVIDVGAGVGAVGIAIALRNPAATLVLVEKDPATARLARENLDLNGLACRAAVAEADIFDKSSWRASGIGFEKAALVVSNPPFYVASNVRSSPIEGRRRAHILESEDPDIVPDLSGWIRACLALAAAKGRFAMIHRPDALPAILHALDGPAGAVKISPVLPKRGGDATRVLVSAVKGGRSPLTIGPPLILHGDDGRFSPEAEARHRAP